MQAALPLMVAGQLVQGIAGYSAGKANQRIANTNALSEINDGEARAAHVRDISRAAMGDQIGSLAGNGFELGGSATTRLAESALEAEMEIANERRTARSRAAALRAQGKTAAREGTNRLIGGLFGAAQAVTGARADYAQLGASYGYGGGG
jgi:hypothetical protein